MPINIQDYLLGRIPVGRKIDIPAYLMAKAASGGRIQEITGTLPLAVRSRASQVLKNYRIYGTASGAGVRTENLWNPAMNFEAQKYINVNGVLMHDNNYSVSDYMPMSAGTVFTISSVTTYYPSSACHAFYDTNQNLIRTLFVGKANESNTFTTPEGCAYARFTVRTGTVDINGIMLVEDRTLPDVFVPHGYKLPLTVSGETENICDTIAENAISFWDGFQIVNNQIISTGNMLMGILCKVKPNTTYICGAKASQPTVMRVREYSARPSTWADSDYIRQTITNASTEQTPTFTTTSATEYIAFCFYTTQTDIVVHNLMVVEGSIFPPEYIPPRYMSDVPIYIGDSQLGEEEYVDYETGKVWKQYGELILAGNEDNIYYYGAFEGVNTFYIDLPNNQQLVTGSPYLWCNHYEVKEQIFPALDKSCRYQNTSKILHIWNIGRIYFFDNDYASLSEFRAHLTELYNANTPLKVRYLLKDAPVPTDPPVPLPDISLPQGEVTIDTEEELKPQATIEGKIKQIT